LTYLRPILVEQQNPPAAVSRLVILGDDEEAAESLRCAGYRALFMAEVFHAQARERFPRNDKETVSTGYNVEVPAGLIVDRGARKWQAKIEAGQRLSRFQCDHH
jgi:hypothetical protein